jgi:hypothetical protein
MSAADTVLRMYLGFWKIEETTHRNLTGTCIHKRFIALKQTLIRNCFFCELIRKSSFFTIAMPYKFSILTVWDAMLRTAKGKVAKKIILLSLFYHA